MGGAEIHAAPNDPKTRTIWSTKVLVFPNDTKEYREGEFCFQGINFQIINNWSMFSKDGFW